MFVLTIKLLISELFNRSVSSTYHKPIRDGPLEIVWVGEGAGGGGGGGGGRKKNILEREK